SVGRALRAMGRSDVAVLLIDAIEGITEQDTKIVGLALKQGRACIIVVNKWGHHEGEPGAKKTFTSRLERRFPFLSWAPVLFLSALKPDSLGMLLPTIDQVMAAFTSRVPTGPLNLFFQELLKTHPLPSRKGRPSKTVKSVFITQGATRPPAFALFVGRPENITPAYTKFLENRLREKYGFAGTPIRILVRRK